jgi:hypothetical protein
MYRQRLRRNKFSESVIQAELDHARPGAVIGIVLRGDPAEAGIIYRLVIQKEVRVIEYVEEVGV